MYKRNVKGNVVVGQTKHLCWLVDAHERVSHSGKCCNEKGQIHCGGDEIATQVRCNKDERLLIFIGRNVM